MGRPNRGEYCLTRSTIAGPEPSSATTVSKSPRVWFTSDKKTFSRKSGLWYTATMSDTSGRFPAEAGLALIMPHRNSF